MSFQVKKFSSIVASLINWMSSNQDKITDFNVGSVARTILESVAIELEELYYQLLRAVEEAIEESIYRAFNFPRNPAERSTGLVRFYRLSGTDFAIIVPRLSQISTDTEPAVVFETQSDETIPVADGTATSGTPATLIDIYRDFVADGVIVGSRVLNVSDNGETQAAGVLSITTTTAANDTLNFAAMTNGADFSINSTWFDKVYFNTTDYSIEASEIGLFFPVGLQTTDQLYMGSSLPFFSFQFNLGATANIQAVIALSIVEYWNGTTWTAVSNMTDGTISAGKSFAQNGNVYWRMPSDWVQLNYQGFFMYWIRVRTDTNMTPTAEGDYVKFRRGDTYKVIVPYKDIDVQSTTPGIIGNVRANSITTIKSNLSNIERVNNFAAFADGKEEETDLERKARFALYIQSLTRATKGALEYAARTVEQVIAATAIDDVRPNVLKYDSAGLLYTDITSQMRNPADGAVKLFPDAETSNDALYIGGNELFEYINMHMFQVGVIGTNNLIWEYYGQNAGGPGVPGWADLTPYITLDGTDDGSGPLTQSGSLSFTIPTDWIVLTIAFGIVSYTRLWVRLRITAPGVTYSTTPTGSFASLPPGFGYVFLYCHDGSGELSDSLKAAVEAAVEGYRGCGIVVEVREPTKIQPTIDAIITVAANYDATDIANKVRQAIIDYLNTKVLGEDLYLAELYQFAMDKYDKAILNTIINLPTADIIVPSSGVIRPDPSLITISGVSI
jgi:hypothetical protein